MRPVLLAIVLGAFALPGSAQAQAAIQSAMSAAPASILADATVMDWDFKVIRKGTNEWTCLPDRTETPGTTDKEIGVTYMLQGDTPVSNSDPYASKPTGKDDWVTNLGAHLMMLIPDRTLLAGTSTDHLNGGPWVMWPDTPYAHIMIPLETRGRSGR